jgi:hypothetical protein
MGDVVNIESTEKKYELRDLQAQDIFPMVRIIQKIGFKEFTAAFSVDQVKTLLSSAEGKKDNKKDKKTDGDDVIAIGMSIAMNLADIVISHLGACEQDIYLLIGSLAGLKPKEVAKLPLDVFIGLVVSIFKKKEFAGFIGAVLKYLK